jgi:PAS domain S-box-containing protein
MQHTPETTGASPGPLETHLLTGLREYGIFLLDPAGRVVSWSAGAEAITGYPAAAVLGRPVSMLWREGPGDGVGSGENARTPVAGNLPGDEEPSESSPALATILSRAAATGSARREGWSVRQNGEEYRADESFSAIYGNASDPTGYLVILRDDTARWREAEALHLSQVTFSGILEIASEAVVSVDESQRITFFNRGAEAIFGYSPKEAIGQPLSMLLPSSGRAKHARNLREFGESPVAARYMGDRGEIAGMRKSGEIFPAEASISSLDVGGTRIYTAVLRDVSERRRIEDAVKANSLELARSNAELEQFAYVASHDLQEPLRMVASYTKLLARRYQGKLDADADEFIEYAVDGVNRMQELINDLLAYSRAGSRRRDPVDVPMDEVLERVLKDLGPTIEETGVTVVSGALPVVRGDTGQLAQLLRNLVANAIKFRGTTAPPRVEVSAERVGDEWIFSVADNGIGIAPEFSERIFVIFQRLHSRTEYPGTGIGLSICRKIVERYGGRIWVESDPGEGAVFRFSLPAGEAKREDGATDEGGAE